MKGENKKNKKGKVVSKNRREPQISEEEKAVKVEQERTRINKELFLEELPKCRGIIRLTCQKIGIGERTYYDWRDQDPEFMAEVNKQYINLNDKIKDVLLKKILVEEDGPSVRYYLDRKVAEFMPKAKSEIFTSNRTLEDLLREDEDELNKPKEINGDESNTTEENKEGPERVTGEVISHPNEEGGNSEIQIQQGSGILLEKKDEKKSDSEISTKGNIKNHRRGPAPRVHQERY